MRTSLPAALALAAALLLSACAGSGEIDETAGWSAQRLYGEARDAQASKEWAKAVKYLERLESRYPYGRYAQQAQLEIAYAQWKAGERAASLAAADRFLKLYPNHLNADYAWYLKGLVNFTEPEGVFSSFADTDMTERDPKAARDSHAAFRELVTRFPDSRYAPDAAARMRYLVNTLAQYDVHVARYYMRRSAYLAAVNRAQTAVANYPGSPAAEEALFIMVHAYDKLGLPELRDDADRVMRKNFPESPYYKGPVKRNVAWWRLWDPEW